MAELGVGYISIVPEVSKISPNVARALDGLDPVAERSGQSMGGRISSGIGTALKATAAGVGIAAGGLIAGGISKGMGRLTAIDDAQAKLRGLEHDTQSTALIMESALASVSGTAYGLGDAASLAAGAVAAGIEPGKELTKYLSMTADAAAIAGTDLSEMGSIINQVQTGQVAYTDNLNQLADRGIPIYTWLAEEAGIAAGEVKKLASEGEISSEMFFNAIEKNIGGAALEMGDSFSGAADNFGAALGRVGATGLTPFFDLMQDGFGAGTEALDALNDRMKPLADATGVWLQGTAVPGLVDFKDNALEAWDAFRGSEEIQSLMRNTGVVVGELVDAGRDLAPVMINAGGALADAGAALGLSSWQLAITGLHGIGLAAEAITPPLEMITEFMQDHPTLVAAGVAAWAGFKTVPALMGHILPPFTKLTETAKTGGTNIGLFGSSLRDAYGYARQANPEMGRFGAALTVIGGEGGVASAGLDKAKGAATNLMNVFGGPWGVALAAAGVVVGGLVQANQKAEAAQVAMAEAARDSADAQVALQAAVAGTTGSLNAQSIEAAARVAGNALAEFVEQGEAVSGMMWKVQTDASLWERAIFHVDYKEDVQQTRDLRDSYKALEGALEGMGLTTADVNRIVGEGGYEYQTLMASLEGSGEAGQRAAAELGEARGEIEQMITDARRLDPAVAETAAAIDVLADSASGADDKLGALRSALQAMGLAPKDADLAMREAAEAVDEIVAAATQAETPLENMGAGLVAAAEAGDWSHEGWRDLSRTLEEMSNDLQNVAINGGDVQGTMADQSRALDALVGQYGLTREEIDQLARAMGYVPSEINTLLALEGATEAQQELGDVWAALQSIPPGQSVEMSALTDEAIKDLEAYGFKIDAIPDSDNVTVTATTGDAITNLQNVINRLAEIRSKEVRIAIWQDYYTSGRAVSTGGTAVGQHYGQTGGRFDPATGFAHLPGLFTGGRHGGYRLPSTGPGTERTDGFLALDSTGVPVAHLDKDEWVVNGRSSEKYDRALALINRDDPSVQHLTRLETGGKIGRPAEQILAFADGKRVDGEQASRSLQGALYQWAGINWGDCSAAMAGLARFATGAAPFAARFATSNQDAALAALGFRPGLGDPSKDFSIGWLNGGIGGGHTSGTIAGVNVEMGGGAGGNGKIGGAAAPANHPQYTNHRHLPLAGTSGAGGSAGLTDVMSTSTSGITLENGITVDWGEATRFYDQALGYLRNNTRVFDTGGILGTGQFAFNAGPPERILPAELTKSFDEFMAMTPGIVNALRRGDVGGAQSQMMAAANTMLEAAKLEALTQAERAEVEIETARQQVQDTGRTFGGDWVAQAQIVRDAEQGLVDLRKQLSIETINIRRAEEGVEEARKYLAKAQSQGAVLSESTTRKIEDAEESLRKARADGKPDKIADAEKRLARAREDASKELKESTEDNAENVRRALEDVAKAEQTLAEQREQNEDAALRLEAAERAIAAARYQAVADMTLSVFSSLGAGANHLGAFFDEMSRLAGIVEKTRQEVSKLEMQQITNHTNLLKAQHDLRVSEWDLQRTRAQGAINLVMAEQEVEDARARAALMGATGIEAMSGAMDRFRETGEFSIGEVSESVVENSALVQAALWGVKRVEAENALNALNASYAQAEAQFALAQATLTSVQTAELLQLQTAALEGQARQLYGLTQNQAQGASAGMGGLGGLLGGLGKVIGGGLTALAGFAAGGPLGAIPGAIMAIGGLGESVRGGIDAWNNRGEIGAAWDKMGGLEKVALVGGGLLGGAATIGGAYLGGPEGAALGAQLGETILGTTVGSLQHAISSRIEKQNRDLADQLDRMQLGHGQANASLEEERLLAQLKYLEQRDRAEADVAYAELMQQVATSTSDALTEKLLDAAAVEAARAGRASDAQLAELKRSGDALDQLVELMREQNRSQPAEERIAGGVAQAVSKLIGNMARPGLSAVSAEQYMNAHL